ncbi:MAG: VOC family protein [Pseudomonadota bacterium]
MFDHVKFGVRDFALSRTFYLKALEPIGVTVITDWPPNGAELSQPNGLSSLCLYQTEERPAHLHIAFVAAHRHQVDAFYRAAIDAGGLDNGPPGVRTEYSDCYYAAFVFDPDGHNIEVVCHNADA